MPKEWTILHQTAETDRARGPAYQVSSRRVGVFGSRKAVDAGRFDTREEADAFVAQHRGLDDSVSHIEPQP